MQHQEAATPRKTFGKLTRSERDDLAVGLRDIFWDGQKRKILVLPGGFYLKLA